MVITLTRERYYITWTTIRQEKKSVLQSASLTIFQRLKPIAKEAIKEVEMIIIFAAPIRSGNPYYCQVRIPTYPNL